MLRELITTKLHVAATGTLLMAFMVNQITIHRKQLYVTQYSQFLLPLGMTTGSDDVTLQRDNAYLNLPDVGCYMVALEP